MNDTEKVKGEVVSVGQAVKVVDEWGILHDGLCTRNWGIDGEHSMCINVVFVTAEFKKMDDFGFQKEHLCSCCHVSMQSAPGRYWYIDPKHARSSDVRGNASQMIADAKRVHEEHLARQK